MTDQHEKLGTCDWQGKTDPSYDTRYHQTPHERVRWCSNWREHPAQPLEANVDTFMATNLPEGAVEGMSAEQLHKQAEHGKKIIGTLLDAWEGINNDFRCNLEDEFPSFYRALQELYSVVESGEFWAELAKLREELDFMTRKQEGSQKSYEAAAQLCVELREKGDALRLRVDAFIEGTQAAIEERKELESALAEARNKALDEVLEYIPTVTGPTGGWLVSPKKVEDRLLALKSPPAEQGKERG